MIAPGEDFAVAIRRCMRTCGMDCQGLCRPGRASGNESPKAATMAAGTTPTAVATADERTIPIVIYRPQQLFMAGDPARGFRSNTTGTSGRVSWTGLVRMLNRAPVGDPKRHPNPNIAKAARGGWSACRLIGGRRLASAFVETRLLGLDIDRHGDIDEALRAFGPFKKIVHSTYKSTAANPRCRVILALKEPCFSTETYKRGHLAVRHAVVRGAGSPPTTSTTRAAIRAGSGTCPWCRRAWRTASRLPTASRSTSISSSRTRRRRRPRQGFRPRARRPRTDRPPSPGRAGRWPTPRRATGTPPCSHSPYGSARSRHRSPRTRSSRRSSPTLPTGTTLSSVGRSVTGSAERGRRDHRRRVLRQRHGARARAMGCRPTGTRARRLPVGGFFVIAGAARAPPARQGRAHRGGGRCRQDDGRRPVRRGCCDRRLVARHVRRGRGREGTPDPS